MLLPKNKIAFSVVTTCAFIAGLIIYIASLNTFFVSDDFIVLDNLIKGNLVYGTAFRPLSNLSLLMDYKIAGLSPICYKLTSLLIHLINSILVFVFAKNILKLFKTENIKLVAAVSSVLFFVFPFHIEAVTWITCRGTLLATTFFLFAVIFYLKDNFISKTISILLFFTGIYFYESIIVFPFIVLLIEWYKGFSLKKITSYFSRLTFAFALYTLVKYFYTSAIVSSWLGETIHQLSIQQTAKNIFISFSRCFLPPQESTALFVLFAVMLIMLFTIIILKFRKSDLVKAILLFFGLIFISLLPAFLIGTDSHDTEGGRLLYLPAVISCLAIAFFISRVSAQNNLHGIILFTAVLIYFLFYLRQYNNEWKIAGTISRSATDKICETQKKNIYVYGLPQQHRGAYIFRNGFAEAAKIFCNNPPSQIIMYDYEFPVEEIKIDEYKLNPDTGILYFSEHKAHIDSVINCCEWK